MVNAFDWIAPTTPEAGIAGALYFLQQGRISPDAGFSVLQWTAYVIFIVVIGGIGSVEGPILGAIIFVVLQSTLASFGAWYPSSSAPSPSS